MIWLPLNPASLTHKNPQRNKIIYGMRPVGPKERSKRVFVEISLSCKFCGSYYGCCLTMYISFSLCCALNRSPDYTVWLHKGPSIFNFGLVFFYWELGRMIFDKMSPRTHHNYLYQITAEVYLICRTKVSEIAASTEKLIELNWKLTTYNEY